MEIQLQELIEQIKKNGVETAEKEAASIISAANAESEKILAEAKEKADAIVQDAKNQATHLMSVGEESLRQASRNLLISFRESVTKELEYILREEVADVYSSDNLSALITKVVEAWTKNNDAEDISVLLNTKDLSALENALLSSIRKKMLEGVTLKANDNFDGGFRIAVNNGRAYYDYSSEAVVDMLSAYLSPKVTALLKEAEKV